MKQKNIICIPYAYEKNMNSGVNISKDSGGVSVYLKNACVALISAKHYNACDIALVTNLQESEIPAEYLQLLKAHGIQILNIPFGNFRFAGTYKWSLAFYKLNVLKWLSQSKYEKVCYIDTDVYVQGSFDSIWAECDENILLYDINHGLNNKDYNILCDEVEEFLGCRKMITHYGGEFYASSAEKAKLFCDECEKIYNKMSMDSFATTKGDEFIISLAADILKLSIKNAGAYVYRFWCGYDFRLISTCYRYNRVIILHVPAEKERGMIKLYDNHIKRGDIPSDNVVWRTLHLLHVAWYGRIKRILKKMINY